MNHYKLISFLIGVVAVAVWRQYVDQKQAARLEYIDQEQAATLEYLDQKQPERLEYVGKEYAKLKQQVEEQVEDSSFSRPTKILLRQYVDQHVDQQQAETLEY
eukprot:Selendium_serpulae@DN6444_c0_g1_i8.p1